ncbi:MAG: TraX family protein, partial [Eubacteriales bacterium]|nr:TraX family protein [Eubacteriales bacterium]
IGRLAFPIFCFLIVEGSLHTRNRFKYGRNLLLFALISELPWNYVHSGGLTYKGQNVFFTLFLGYLGMCAFEYLRDQQFLLLLALLALLFASVALHADYGYRGYILLLILYTLRSNRPAQAVIASCWLAFEWKACFAFLPINMYNGKRGFIRGPVGKYFFYAFYPLHMLILGYIKFHM